jgi:hypothetical protein
MANNRKKGEYCDLIFLPAIPNPTLPGQFSFIINIQTRHTIIAFFLSTAAAFKI